MSVKYHEFDLYVPVNRGDGSNPVGFEWKDISEELIERFNGYSLIGPLDGAWRNDVDKIIRENVYIFRIVTDKPLHAAIANIRFVAKTVKRVWLQESVLWTCKDITAEFYTE